MTFVDPDGEKLEFRVNSASGKIDVFVNDQLFDSGLTECTRNAYNDVHFVSNSGEEYLATAPDEDTARRVIELFEYCSSKARFQNFLICAILCRVLRASHFSASKVSWCAVLPACPRCFVSPFDALVMLVQ